MVVPVVLEHARQVVGGVEVAALADGQHQRVLAGSDNFPEDCLIV